MGQCMQSTEDAVGAQRMVVSPPLAHTHAVGLWAQLSTQLQNPPNPGTTTVWVQVSLLAG